MAAPEIDSTDGIKVGGVLIQSGDITWEHGADKHTNRTRKMFVSRPNVVSTGGTSDYGVTLDSSTDEDAKYNFKLPEDFVSLTSVKAVYGLPIAIGLPKTVVYDTTVKFGAVGELLTAHSTTVTGVSETLDNGNIDTITISGSSFTGITKDDYVFVEVLRDANHGSDDFAYDWVILGIEVEYIADM